MKGRVILAVYLPRYDTSRASEHGEVVYLFRALNEVNPANPQSAFKAILRRLLALDFNEHDQICLTGPLPLVTLLAMAASTLEPRVNILIFDARDSRYHLNTVDCEVAV